MWKFIIQILLVSSLAAIIYIFARVLPRIDDTEFNKKAPRTNTHWFIIYLEKADEWLKAYSEKFLRRIRVFILKLDNLIANKLHRFKKQTPKETVISMNESNSEIPKKDLESNT